MEVWGNAATQYAEQQHELDAALAVDKIQAVYDMYLNGRKIPIPWVSISQLLDTTENDAGKGIVLLFSKLDQGTMEFCRVCPSARRLKQLSVQANFVDEGAI